MRKTPTHATTKKTAETQNKRKHIIMQTYQTNINNTKQHHAQNKQQHKRKSTNTTTKRI